MSDVSITLVWCVFPAAASVPRRYSPSGQPPLFLTYGPVDYEVKSNTSGSQENMPEGYALVQYFLEEVARSIALDTRFVDDGGDGRGDGDTGGSGSQGNGGNGAGGRGNGDGGDAGNQEGGDGGTVVGNDVDGGSGPGAIDAGQSNQVALASHKPEGDSRNSLKAEAGQHLVADNGQHVILDQCIGRGSYGTVFSARVSSLQVATKFATVDHQPVLEHEYAILRRLHSCPGVVQPLAFITNPLPASSNWSSAFVMELAQGPSVRAVALSMEVHVRAEFLVRVLPSMLVILQDVHSRGVFHGDAKLEHFLFKTSKDDHRDLVLVDWSVLFVKMFLFSVRLVQGVCQHAVNSYYSSLRGASGGDWGFPNSPVFLPGYPWLCSAVL